MSWRIQRSAWRLAVVLAWCWAWRHLSSEWRTNEQYEFGYGVPFLFAYCAWKRWSGTMQPSRSGWPLLAVAWLTLALGELLRWHDPTWRFTGGLLVLGATLLTAVLFLREGGAPLLRRELFPLAFAWLALPWPVPVELFVTQHLLHFVTSVTVTLVNDLGIAALQHGNIIELSGGLIGVNRACSGVQSLQASLVPSLFLGEFFRLTSARRIVLFSGGWVIAVLANLSRILAVTLVAHRSGIDAALARHDLAGGTVTTITFLAIFVLAFFLTGKNQDEKNEAPSELDVREKTAAFSGGLAVLCIFSLIPILSNVWFSRMQIPQSEMPQTPLWKIDMANLPPGWSAEAVAPTESERSMLQFSEWEAFRVQSAAGWSAQIVHLFWKPGEGMPSMAFYHTPAMCMPWVGWHENGAPERVTLPLPSGEIPCVMYRFDQGNVRQTVLQSLASAGRADFFTVDPMRLGGRFSRLSMLWREPLRQVNEELLIYVPETVGAQPLDVSREIVEHLVRISPRK